MLAVCLTGAIGWLAADTSPNSADPKKSPQNQSAHKKTAQKQSAQKKSTLGKAAPRKSKPGKSAGKSTAGPHKSVAGKSGKSTTHKPAPAGKHAVSSQGSKRTARGAPARSWRAGQTAPSPDRYKEIQAALAKKGYLHGEPTGKWDDESVDALRRFQQDQNLHPSGKLDSLSIIALGLGPKYDASTEKPQPPQP